MSVYDVAKPCIVGGKHYTRPKAGVQVDDAEAAPLVEEGVLVAVEPETVPGDSEQAAETVPGDPESADADSPAPRRGGRAR